LSENFFRGIDQIGLAQRLADILALRGEKGVRHRAADHEQIDLGKEARKKRELRGNLGAADDRGKRLYRIGEGAGERRKLRLHGAASKGGEFVRNAFGRSMRAVRSREGVVDINVAEF